MTEARKLTPRQAKIVELMLDGWELGTSDGGAWMQRKLMRGGEAVNVHIGTVWSLRDRGIIRSARRKSDPCWLSRYRLCVAAPVGPEGAQT